MQTQSLDQPAGATPAYDELIARLNRLAHRLGKPKISDLRDGVDLAPPIPPRPPTKGDTINKVADRLVEHDDLEFKGEPAADGRPTQERSGAVHTGEFQQLKCTGERPPSLDRHAAPYVISNVNYRRAKTLALWRARLTKARGAAL